MVQKEKRCVRLCLLLTHSPSFRPSYGHPNLATFSQLQNIPLLEHIMGIGHCWSKRCETLLMSTDNLDVEIPFCLFGRPGLMGEKSWFCTSFAFTVKNKQLQPRIKRWAFWQQSLHSSNAYWWYSALRFQLASWTISFSFRGDLQPTPHIWHWPAKNNVNQTFKLGKFVKPKIPVYLAPSFLAVSYRVFF